MCCSCKVLQGSSCKLQGVKINRCEEFSWLLIAFEGSILNKLSRLRRYLFAVTEKTAPTATSAFSSCRIFSADTETVHFHSQQVLWGYSCPEIMNYCHWSKSVRRIGDKGKRVSVPFESDKRCQSEKRCMLQDHNAEWIVCLLLLLQQNCWLI